MFCTDAAMLAVTQLEEEEAFDEALEHAKMVTEEALEHAKMLAALEHVQHTIGG